jgi:enoyl-CoA hydratase
MVEELKEIYTEQRGLVKYIILDRPEKLNAFTHDMADRLRVLLEETRNDPGTSVLVIKGKGTSFSAGHDLNQVYKEREPYAIPTATGDERRRGFRWLNDWFNLLWELPQPVIAQVQGYCFNFALELAMNSDFVIASEDAKFVSRGVGGAGRLFHLWPWLIGPRKTKEYGMLGGAVSGIDAERLGMINHAVPLEELDAAVDDFADRLTKIPLELLSLEKKSVNVTLEMMNIRPALGYTMELHAMGHLTEASSEVAHQLIEEGWKSAWAKRDAERFGDL